MPLINSRTVGRHSRTSVLGGRYRPRTVILGGSFWSRIKDFARKIFGSSKAKELAKKVAAKALEAAPGLIDKGLAFAAEKLPHHAILNPGGANAKKAADFARPHLNTGAKEGIAQMENKFLSIQPDGGAIVVGRRGGRKKKPVILGMGMQTISPGLAKFVQ
jgi:hypothetical protein